MNGNLDADQFLKGLTSNVEQWPEQFAKRRTAHLAASGKSFPQLQPRAASFQTGKSPALGPAPGKAKVEVVVFEDFQCPFCSKIGPSLKSFQARFPKQVRLVFKHMPLRSIHADAQLASEAAAEAQAQGKFWEYHDLLFANQKKL